MTKRVIIAGSRTFDDLDKVIEALDLYISANRNHEIIVVSGGARGADTLGEEAAAMFGLTVERFPADWNTQGKRAGMLRNIQMAETATCLIAFWDGKSKGTQHMIDLARKKGLYVAVYHFEPTDPTPMSWLNNPKSISAKKQNPKQ